MARPIPSGTKKI
jgi:hypothetical protein